MIATTEQVSFESEGATLRGLLYVPEQGIKLPGLVMAHGTSATTEMVANRYADMFCAAGVAVLLYDHRNFGMSGGTPRFEINPWIQARGYRDAISYLASRTEVDGSRIGIWGDSYSGMHVLVVAALDSRVRAVVAQCPVCGSQKPRAEPSEQVFERMRATFDNGDVSGTPETTVGPLPVVSFDQVGSPSMLKPIQAFRWFIEYGGRHGSRWENSVTRVVPPTPVPFSPYLAAPYITADLMMMVAPEDEMVHCNPAVARATFDLVPGHKEWTEIAGGHFGLLYHPSELFAEATAKQCDFLIRRLKLESDLPIL